MIKNCLLCAAHLLLPLSVCVSVALVTAQASAADDETGFENTAEEIVRMDIPSAQHILAQKLPEGANRKAELDYLIQRQQAAFVVGDGAARIAALEKLVELNADAGNATPYLGYLWNEEWRHGNQTRALEIGERIVRDHSLTPTYRALTAAQIGSCYLELSGPDKAQAMLNQAEDLKREAETAQKFSDVLYISAEIERLRAGITMSRGDYASAEVSIRKAAVLSLSEIKRVHGLTANNQKTMLTDRSVRERDANQGLLISILIAQGKNVEAENQARLGLRTAQVEKTTGANTGNWLRKLAQAKLGQRRYAEAADYARQALSIYQNNGVNASSSRYETTQVFLLQALFGQQKWAEADQTFEAIKLATADDAAARTRIDSPTLRAILHLYNGRADLALQTIDGSVRYRSRNFGDKNPVTIEAKAVRAMVYQERKSTSQALSDYDDVFKSIFAQETSFNDAEPAGLRGFYTPLALRAYLRLVQSSYKENGNKIKSDMINDSFRVADRLRTSVVQRALIDSAARVVADTPELAALIRKEQDQRRDRNESMGKLTQLLDEDQKLMQEQKEREKNKESYTYAQAQQDKQQAKARHEVIESRRHHIAELEQQREQALVDLGKAFPKYQALVNPKPPTLDQLAKQLKTGEALISIYPTTENSFVWGVNASGDKAFHVSALTSSDVKTLVEKVRKTLDVGDRPDPAKVAFDYASSNQLYKELVEPVLSRLPDSKSLSFAVSGELGELPLAVLITRRNADNLDDAAWLIKDMAVNQIATASAFYAARDNGKKNSAPKAFMGFGDPLFQLKAAAPIKKQDLRHLLVRSTQGNARTNGVEGAESFNASFDYSSVPPLPETRDEILSMAGTLGASNTDDVFFGKDASRKKVMGSDLSDRRIVAFATHGLKPGDLPGLSRPALAMAATADATESPLLSLDDILTLKMNADWVILSACNSASDDGSAEEALSGLARGFFFAGSKAVLVTHWAVETLSAQELTTRTMQNYSKNAGLGRAESLRAAQLDMIGGKSAPQFRHPFFWAAFATSGDPLR